MANTPSALCIGFAVGRSVLMLLLMLGVHFRPPFFVVSVIVCKCKPDFGQSLMLVLGGVECHFDVPYSGLVRFC